MISTLLVMAEEGERDRVRYLYRTFHDDMLRLAKKRLKQAGRVNYQSDAEDVVQSAFVKLVKYINRIDFEKSEKELLIYVLTVTENEIAELLTQWQPLHLSESALDDISEEAFYNELARSESQERLEKVLRSLDPQDTVVLVLRFLEERSIAEIVEILGISTKDVYARIKKAKKALIKRMQEVK